MSISLDESAGVALKELKRIKNREKQARWKARNPEKVKLWSAIYVSKSKDKRKASYVNNRPSRLAYSKAYKAKNIELIRAQKKEYRSNNLEKGRASNHRRRARKLGVDGKIDPAIDSWSKAWHGLKKVRCYWCEGSFSPKACHEDHIVALKLGGKHAVDNLCVSCAPCNLSKQARPLSTWNATLSSPVLAL